MADRRLSCCFTGHRPVRLPWKLNEDDPRCIALKEQITLSLEKIYECGYRHYICGMAIGCDTYFAEAVLALKRKYGDLTLEAAIPCEDQADKWNRKQRERYQNILSLCDLVTYVSKVYSPGCMMRRNEYMIDHSSLLLACFNGRSSGTMNTILYAQRSGVKTMILDI